MFAPLLRDSLPDSGPAVDSGAAGAPGRLLLVDDDEHMIRTLGYYFEKRGFHVVAVATVAAAQTAFSRYPGWTLVIADYHLPDGNGWQLCCWIRSQNRGAPPFLLISGAATAQSYSSAVPFLAKPFSVAELAARVNTILCEPRS